MSFQISWKRNDLWVARSTPITAVGDMPVFVSKLGKQTFWMNAYSH